MNNTNKKGDFYAFHWNEFGWWIIDKKKDLERVHDNANYATNLTSVSRYLSEKIMFVEANERLANISLISMINISI